MTDEELKARGWEQIGPNIYLHYCGAEVVKRGKTWVATSVSGETISKQSSIAQAFDATELNDHRFWSCGAVEYERSIAGVGFLVEPAGCGGTTELQVFACSPSVGSSLPTFLLPYFNKLFLGGAACRRCGLTMRRIRTLELPYFRHGYSSRKVFFVCDCDHPVWSMEREVFCSALSRMQRYQHRWRRIQLLKDADGRHTQKEMERIVIAQRGRCICCNVRFSERVRPSKDHIVPLTFGGTNYASNLVAACRSCNSRRGNTPFFTYCRLLSLSQYERTVVLLCRRLMAVDFAEISDDEIVALRVGLTYDDPKDGRYVYILETQRRRKPVALLASSLNKVVRREARKLFYGKNSIICAVVDEAISRAYLERNSEGENN